MIAGFRFGIVVGVRLGKTGFPDRGHLGPQAFELLVQQGLVGQKRRELFVSFVKFGFQPLQLIEGLPGDGRKFSKRGGIKRPVPARVSPPVRRCGRASSRRGTIRRPP